MMILGQTGVALTLTAVVGGGWTGLIQSKIHSQSPSLQEQMIGNYDLDYLSLKSLE